MNIVNTIARACVLLAVTAPIWPGVSSANDDIASFDSFEAWYDRTIPFGTPKRQTRTFGREQESERIKLSVLYVNDRGTAGVGCFLSESNRIATFVRSDWSTKGGGYPQLGDEVAAKADQIIANLPAEHPQAPKRRHVLISLPDGESWRTWTYDRANLPPEIIALSNRLHGIVPAVVVNISPTAKIETHRRSHRGGFALSPDGEDLVTGTGYKDLQVWGVNDHRRRSLDLDKSVAWRSLSGLTFSHKGDFLVGFGYYGLVVMETSEWEVVAELKNPHERSSTTRLYFTSDDQFIVACSGRGPTVFQTSDWTVTTLPRLTEDVLLAFESQDGRWQVLASKPFKTVLRSADPLSADRVLDEERPASHAAFSPDGTMVAVAIPHRRESRPYEYDAIRLYDIQSGQLLRELCPFEIRFMESVEGLTWSPDSQYLLAANKSHSFWTSRPISVWNIETGRHRADFIGCPTNVHGIGVTPDGKTLVAGCKDGVVRFWDLEAGLAEIGEFERQFTGSTPGR